MATLCKNINLLFLQYGYIIFLVIFWFLLEPNIEIILKNRSNKAMKLKSHEKKTTVFNVDNSVCIELPSNGQLVIVFVKSSVHKFKKAQ